LVDFATEARLWRRLRTEQGTTGESCSRGSTSRGHVCQPDVQRS